MQLFIVYQLEEFQPWIIYQHDGAPPHWGSVVRQFLDEKFPDRWIGRDEPIPWSPRSPDITPLDFFFFWGYIKDRVFVTPVRDIETLKARIADVASSVTEQMLDNTWRELDYHLTFSELQRERTLRFTKLLDKFIYI